MRGPENWLLAELPRPRTVHDMAAIAVAFEREAQRRYLAFAEETVGLARPQTVSLIRRIAGEHGGRAERLAGSGEDEGAALALPGALWAEIFAEEESAVCDRAGVTPYKVLAFAVAAAQRGFALYSYLAAAATDPVLRESAEHRAAERLSRAAELRVERRRAYRAEGKGQMVLAIPPAALVGTLSDLSVAALFVEEALAEHLARFDGGDAVIAFCLGTTRRQVQDLQHQVSAAEPPGRPLVAALAELGPPVAMADPGDEIGGDARSHLLEDCKRAFTFYDRVAGMAAGEAVMLKAQELSQSALERVKALAAGRRA